MNIMCPCVYTGYLTASKKEQQLQAELDTIRRKKDQQISRLEQELRTKVSFLRDQCEQKILEQKGEQNPAECQVHGDNQ